MRRTASRGSDSRKQIKRAITNHRSQFRTLDPLPRGQTYPQMEVLRRQFMNRSY